MEEQTRTVAQLLDKHIARCDELISQLKSLLEKNGIDTRPVETVYLDNTSGGLD